MGHDHDITHLERAMRRRQFWRQIKCGLRGFGHDLIDVVNERGNKQGQCCMRCGKRTP